MAKSIAELLNNKESRERILVEVKAELDGFGLLDSIPSSGLDGEPLDSEKGWTRSDKSQEPKEIDYGKTSDEMILEGKVVLKK
jgi:hypothetical protein